MIEIILGAILTVLTLWLKKIFPESVYEKKVRESLIILLSFGLTLIVVVGYYLLSYKKVITPEFIQMITEVMAMAVGFYEILYKQVVRPILIALGVLTETEK